MRKLTALFAVVTALVVLSSSAWACWTELPLQPEALVGARIYCLHEASNKKVSYADRLRFGELAEMIGAGQVTYAEKYDPREWVHASQVWHLYLAALELEQKLELKKKAAVKKASQINKIKNEARLWAARNKK